MLSLFHSYGYQLVIPPLMEYTQSLLTNIDQDLSLKTIRIADRFSGRQLGLRADITPQISRIDAHLLSANDDYIFSHNSFLYFNNLPLIIF